MMETLSNGKGKIFTTEYTDGGLWIVGEEGAVAEISRKLEARGATKARESELGRLCTALKKGMENDKTPPRKKELLASLIAEGGIESAILEKWKAKRSDTLQRVDAL
ncbi:MAG: uncharacterized protein A8A55_1981 [Amphiamblys sp. WSBS2006]|nr:MAG: uncharacterized protein A8A55_1981 [Amphiamblys sp. WSBS2006]